MDGTRCGDPIGGSSAAASWAGETLGPLSRFPWLDRPDPKPSVVDDASAFFHLPEPVAPEQEEEKEKVPVRTQSRILELAGFTNSALLYYYYSQRRVSQQCGTTSRIKCTEK